jgi:hypothetical protein
MSMPRINIKSNNDKFRTSPVLKFFLTVHNKSTSSSEVSFL